MNDLLDRVRTSTASGFYRDHWGKARAFSELPLLTRDDLAQTPLSERRYKDVHALVKIINTTRSFLCESAVEDIADESFGERTKRPMVYFADTHEAVEKGMWCFANGMPRVFGEHNPAVSVAVMEKFEIDSLIADVRSLEMLAPHLAKRGALESLSLVSESFDVSVARFAPLAKRFRLVLALPEVGALAEASFADEPRFAPVSGVNLEIIKGNLIVTKERLLVTPIIRYDTGIRVRGDIRSFALA